MAVIAPHTDSIPLRHDNYQIHNRTLPLTSTGTPTTTTPTNHKPLSHHKLSLSIIDPTTLYTQLLHHTHPFLLASQRLEDLKHFFSRPTNPPTTVSLQFSYIHTVILFSPAPTDFYAYDIPLDKVPRYLASIGSKLSALSYSKSNGLRVGGFLTLFTNLSTPHFSTPPGPGYIDS